MPPKHFLKATNRSIILNTIKSRGPIARTDIARYTGLSPAGVTGITAELIEEELVFEKQEGDSRGGRRPILLALNSEGAYVVGIKLAEGSATFALTDLNASVLRRHSAVIDTRRPERVAAQLAEIVCEMTEAAGMRIDRLLGIGIGLPDIVETTTGICRVSPFDGWHEVAFAQLVEDKLGLSVVIDNDVNTLTVYERLYGAGRHVEDFLVATLERGVGLGIVLDGQIYRGARGGAGEFGHTNVDPQGPLCNCGCRGCLETFVGDAWLLRHSALNGLSVDSPDGLVQAANEGSAIALRVLAQAGEVFGRSLANVINLLNPALIIISGEGVRAGEHLFEPMRKAIRAYAFQPLGDDVDIRVEALHDDSWARGAACLVLDNIFASPNVPVPNSR